MRALQTKKTHATRHAVVRLHIELRDAAHIKIKDVRAYLKEAVTSCVRDLPDVVNLSSKVKRVACRRISITRP